MALPFALPFEVLQGLDVLSAALTLIVAGFFARSWRRTEDPSLLLFALGFALVGLTFVSVSTGEFDLAPRDAAWDSVRLAGQLGGAVVIVAAYVGTRLPARRRVSLALGAAALAASLLLMGLYWLVPPSSTFPGLEVAAPWAHGLMALAYAACTVFAARGVLRDPVLARALVPAAFLAWALTKYTWLLVDLSGAEGLALVVYFWRFVALGLLLAALVAPLRLPAGGGHAAA